MVADDDFSETPETLGERRAQRSTNAADWSPRDLLVTLLRDHDSGKRRLEAVVVCFEAEEGIGFFCATPNIITSFGLLAHTQAAIQPRKLDDG